MTGRPPAVVYSSQYQIDLPGHIWPTSKQADRRAAQPTGECRFVEPVPASWDTLRWSIPPNLRKLRDNTLTPHEIATLELPRVPALADACLMTGGNHRHRTGGDGGRRSRTSAAACTTRSPIMGKGSGSTTLRSRSASCRPHRPASLAQDGAIRRAAVVDPDAHHGNGTAMISSATRAFTFTSAAQLPGVRRAATWTSAWRTARATTSTWRCLRMPCRAS
jgi:hypothetical protein